MATDITALFWSDQPKARLRIRNADERLKERLVQELLSESPTKPYWPYGMPTSVNPWLLLVGISPGAAGKEPEDIPTARKNYKPTAGEIHPRFNTERFWESQTEWKGYWPKIRELCSGLLHDKVGDDIEKILSTCGHLNLGEAQNGTGDDKAIDPRILRWVPRVISDQLRPSVLLLLGLKSHKSKGTLNCWKGTGLEFILSSPCEATAFKCSDGKRRSFETWRNPVPGAYPKKVIMLPTHPSRYPLTDGDIWRSMVKQLKPLVFE